MAWLAGIPDGLTMRLSWVHSVMICVFLPCLSVKQLQHIPIDVGSPIMCCSNADPYVLIMSEEGLVMVLTLKDEYATGPRLVVSRPQIMQVCSPHFACKLNEYIYNHALNLRISTEDSASVLFNLP